MVLAALLSIAAAPACPVSLDPIVITVVPLPAASLGGQAEPSLPGQYRVGEFTYRGYGIVETSSDPRFRDLVLDRHRGLRHRCGNGVSGPSGWNALDPNLARWTMRIDPRQAPSEPSRGSLEAGLRGTRPVLKGYVDGPTWPVFSSGKRYFLGLMHPADGAAGTLIVAFRDAPGPTPALVVARMTMTLDTLSLLPDLHRPLYSVALDALSGTTLTKVVLHIGDDRLNDIGARLTIAP